MFDSLQNKLLSDFSGNSPQILEITELKNVFKSLYEIIQ